MNSIAALACLIENLVHFGTIAEVDEKKARVRVKSGELLTTWLPWQVFRAGADRDWNPLPLRDRLVYLEYGAASRATEVAEGQSAIIA